MVNHDAPHQLRGDRDKVGPALPDRLRVIDQPQIRFVDKRGGLQSVAGALPAHVMVGQPVQFGLHQREQLLKRSLVSAAPVAEQLGDLLLRDRWASSYRLLDAAHSNTFEGFLQHGRRRLKKDSAVVAGFRRPFRFNR